MSKSTLKTYLNTAFSYKATLNEMVANFQKVTTTISTFLIVFLLITFSEIAQARIFIETTGGGKTRGEICGSIQTRKGDTMTLREEETLSSKEFTKIQLGKLVNANATFHVLCAIQMCGFTSYGKRINDSYIGSDSDYADCTSFVEHTVADETIFNQLYNWSSISCGCYKEQTQCICIPVQLELYLVATPGRKMTAILYRENDCNDCYLNSIQLSADRVLTTDNSHHVLSMLVRDKCGVHFRRPSFKKMYQFAHIAEPIVFESGPTEYQVSSGYQGEPEYFECSCHLHPTSPPHFVVWRQRPYYDEDSGVEEASLGPNLVYTVWRQRPNHDRFWEWRQQSWSQF